jgi:hypothetical protein
MKKIKWLAENDFVLKTVPKPQSAKKYIPEWYKEIKRVTEKELTIDKETMLANLNLKHCMPFLDSLMSGYIQETWCDIYIEIKNDELFYHFPSGPTIISHRKKISIKNFPEKYFYPIEFEWRQYWIPKLPLGYSAIYTHPFNRIDLPFYSLTGIVENDLFFVEKDGGNHPFYIKKDFQGLIPAGTPMYQIIPIKRERWISLGKKINNYSQISPRKFFMDGYKKLYWQKKEYN